MGLPDGLRQWFPWVLIASALAAWLKMQASRGPRLVSLVLLMGSMHLIFYGLTN